METMILKYINPSFWLGLSEKIQIIKLARERFLNWYYVLMHLAFNKFPFVGLLKETKETVTITDFITFLLYIAGMEDITNCPKENYIEFTYLGKKLKIQGINKNGDIGASFLDYNFLDVSGKTVIDIGANIADSSIYFCLKNAKKVIALEPFQYSYNYALQNIILNELSDKIILLKAGYGTDGIITIDDEGITNTGAQLTLNPAITD